MAAAESPRRAEPTIVALGGGGFSTASDEPLDDWLLSLTGRERPRACFLATASGDSDRYIVAFWTAFDGRAEPSFLPLFNRGAVDLRRRLLEQDLIYVGGGNTANMLAVWRLHGVDAILREAWERGIVLCGVSAGALCWFEAGVTDSFGPDLAALRDGLGFLPGSFCPHYDSERGRRPTYRRLVAEGLPGGIAADDGVALRFAGDRLAEVVGCRTGSGAYRVEPRDGEAAETALEVRPLI